MTGNGRSGISLNKFFDEPDNPVSIVSDNVVAGNKEIGIQVSNVSTRVDGNAVSNNGGRGIDAVGGGLSNNVVLGNGGGTMLGIVLGGNLCNGSTTCP